MNLDECIRAAVLPIVPICEPVDYKGEAPEYCTFTYSERGGLFGDDTAEALIYDVTLDWYLPPGVNPNSKKRRLKNALVNADFTYPEVFNASDEEGQHFVFECEREGEP